MKHREVQELKILMFTHNGRHLWQKLEKKLETCKQFLIEGEIEDEGRRVYNFAMDTLDPKRLLEKFDIVFGSLKCAAKLIVACGFMLMNVEDGSCR